MASKVNFIASLLDNVSVKHFQCIEARPNKARFFLPPCPVLAQLLIVHEQIWFLPGEANPAGQLVFMQGRESLSWVVRPLQEKYLQLGLHCIVTVSVGRVI